MLAHAPTLVRGGGVVEDAEQQGGTVRIGASEILSIETEAEGDAFHDRMRRPLGLAHERRNGGLELGHGFREQVCAVQDET